MDSDELCSTLTAIGIILISLFIKARRSVNLFGLSVACGIGLLTTIANPTVPAKMILLNSIIGLLFIKVVADRIEPEGLVKKLGAVALGLAVISNAALFLQIMGKLSFAPMWPDNCGIFLLPWITGVFAVISLPLIYQIHPLLCAVLLPQLFYSRSTIAMVCALAAFGYLWAAQYGRKAVVWLAVSGISIFSAFIYFFDRTIDMNRFKFWYKTSAYIENWFVGNGLGAFCHKGFIMDMGGEKRYIRWAHNEFYQTVFDMGLVTLIAMLCVAAVFFLQTNKYLKAALVSMLALALFHPVFHFGKPLFLFGVLMACHYAQRYDDARL